MKHTHFYRLYLYCFSVSCKVCQVISCRNVYYLFDMMELQSVTLVVIKVTKYTLKEIKTKVCF